MIWSDTDIEVLVEDICNLGVSPLQHIMMQSKLCRYFWKANDVFKALKQGGSAVVDHRQLGSWISSGDIKKHGSSWIFALVVISNGLRKFLSTAAEGVFLRRWYNCGLFLSVSVICVVRHRYDKVILVETTEEGWRSCAQLYFYAEKILSSPVENSERSVMKFDLA